MKVFAVALSTLLASSNVNQVTSSKSEIVNTCKLVDKKQPTGPYAPYTGETKAAHAHLMFRDMDQKVLDVLKSFNNTKATFVIHSDKITDETLPLLQNIVADGHTIASNGQSSNPQINFLYANETLIEQQITGADEDFKKAIGYAPNLYMPSFGAMDTRAHQILDAHDKQTILWSAGSNGWWFIGNNEPLETTVAALRYTMPEMGGIIMMPPDSAVLEEYLTQVWPYW
jgi:peptidoglycan/xylan/chitin deacetylase (PgdA/CDA1 family)